MDKNKIKRISIDKGYSILQTLKIMDEISVRLLIVLEKNKFISLVSIGDLQRAIISNYPLETKIEKIIRQNVEVAHKNEDYDEIKEHMLKTKTEYMPVIDSEKNLVDVIFWDDLFEDKITSEVFLDLPVVIMAGGKGTRMRPITNVIPKPLIPIDDKTISEHIIANFRKVGCHEFYFSVNYKAEMIKTYFNELEKDYAVSFFEETKPLGTAGSLHLLNGKINKTFFISNCDILIEEDYNEMYKYHKEFNNELTIVASFRHYPIPYGTVETGENGVLVELKEKPELSYLINSGMYILEPHLIQEIPQNTFFHITDLIKKIQERGGKVGVFPVNEKAWKDIGEWDKYLMEIKRS